MRVCIIVPMYNEEVIAQESIETILFYVRELPHLTTVLVVNDGSKDQTEAIVKKIIESVGNINLLTIVSHAHNQGYGAALRTGMKFAIENNYDYTMFMDSDLTNHPKYLKMFYDKMGEGWDYIKATRYRKGGGMEGVPWKRRLFSHVGNVCARILFRLPLTDPTNGFRAVKVALLRQINLKENGFPVIMEELYQAKRLTKSFCEVPYILTDRAQGQGDTHFLYTSATIKRYLYYAFKSFFVWKQK